MNNRFETMVPGGVLVALWASALLYNGWKAVSTKEESDATRQS
jgi:hypothetical protein